MRSSTSPKPTGLTSMPRTCRQRWPTTPPGTAALVGCGSTGEHRGPDRQRGGLARPLPARPLVGGPLRRRLCGGVRGPGPLGVLAALARGWNWRRSDRAVRAGRGLAVPLRLPQSVAGRGGLVDCGPRRVGTVAPVSSHRPAVPALGTGAGWGGLARLLPRIPASALPRDRQPTPSVGGDAAHGGDLGGGRHPRLSG